MLYFTRQLYINDILAAENQGELGFAEQDNEVAAKSYQEHLEEIWDELPKSVRRLSEDEEWNKEADMNFVDDHFYIHPSEEWSLMLQNADKQIFLLRYTVEEMPDIEGPSEEDKEFFKAEHLGILADEWDLEDNVLVHRLLLSNGFIMKIKPKSFRWWKLTVEAEA